MGNLETVAAVCTRIMAIAALVAAILKIVREMILGTKAIREAMRCQLRSDMLHTYYKRKDEQKIRQYEAENFAYNYKAYKALKGNSFIDRIKQEVDEWEVVT